MQGLHVPETEPRAALSLFLPTRFPPPPSLAHRSPPSSCPGRRPVWSAGPGRRVRWGARGQGQPPAVHHPGRCGRDGDPPARPGEIRVPAARTLSACCVSVLKPAVPLYVPLPLQLAALLAALLVHLRAGNAGCMRIWPSCVPLDCFTSGPLPPRLPFLACASPPSRPPLTLPQANGMSVAALGADAKLDVVARCIYKHERLFSRLFRAGAPHELGGRQQCSGVPAVPGGHACSTCCWPAGLPALPALRACRLRTPALTLLLRRPPPLRRRCRTLTQWRLQSCCCLCWRGTPPLWPPATPTWLRTGRASWRRWAGCARCVGGGRGGPGVCARGARLELAGVCTHGNFKARGVQKDQGKGGGRGRGVCRSIRGKKGSQAAPPPAYRSPMPCSLRPTLLPANPSVAPSRSAGACRSGGPSMQRRCAAWMRCWRRPPTQPTRHRRC